MCNTSRSSKSFNYFFSSSSSSTETSSYDEWLTMTGLLLLEHSVWYYSVTRHFLLELFFKYIFIPGAPRRRLKIQEVWKKPCPFVVSTSNAVEVEFICRRTMHTALCILSFSFIFHSYLLIHLLVSPSIRKYFNQNRLLFSSGVHQVSCFYSLHAFSKCSELQTSLVYIIRAFELGCFFLFISYFLENVK